MAQNYYDILGITRDATAEARGFLREKIIDNYIILFCGSTCPNLAEEIKRAYKKAALTHHPDKVPPHRFWHVEKPGKEFFRFECKSLDTNFVENT